MTIGVNGPRDLDRILHEVVELGRENENSDVIMENVFRLAMTFALMRKNEDPEEQAIFLKTLEQVIGLYDEFISDARKAHRLIEVAADFPETLQ